MGVGASSDADARDSRAAASRVHLLLADQELLQQAFAEVWRHCGDSSKANKTDFLQVMLHFVEDAQGYSNPEATQTRITRQLSTSADALPAQLSRPEALNLFRTVLLAVQSYLIMQHGPAQPVLAFGSPASQPGAPTTAGGHLQAGTDAEAEPQRLAMSGTPSPTMKASSRAEDTSEAPRLAFLAGPRLHPVLAALAPAAQDRLFACSSLLSRKDLEAQTEQLRGLCEQLATSTREEQVMVQELEQQANAIAALNGAHSQSMNVDQALRNLRQKLQAQQHELRCSEEVRAEQQSEIEALISRRDCEEAEADEACRQSAEIHAEVRSCRRTCGSLESEIESEEARAAALREAFEGRRSRFATAEAAAKNAEISTMRATRRRIAAEVAARREAEAVVQAEHAREEQLSRVAVRCEAISSEIAEARAHALLQGLPDRCGDSSILKAELGTSLQREIDEADRANRAEVAELEDFHRETSELEARLNSLHLRVASRESELHAVQRRILRERSTDSRTPTVIEATRHSEDRKSELSASLQAVERRVAAGRRREQALREQLGQVLACRSLSSARAANECKDLKEASDAAWSRAREIASELGEAQAAIARRRAQEQPGVVMMLKVELQEAEEQEARSMEELAQVRNKTAEDLAEHAKLRKKIAALLSGAEASQPLEEPVQQVREEQSWLPSFLPSWLTGGAATQQGATATA